jgi:S1-C subfamily serine protease
MTTLRPFRSVALLFHDDRDSEPKFLGTCFAYKRQDRFVTARHCVGRLDASELRVLLPLPEQSPSLIQVLSVTAHGPADACILVTQAVPPGLVTPFMGLSARRDWGEPVMALGYPEESTDEGLVPTARLFSGTVQRYAMFDTKRGYRYNSGELSFGAPAGLSGGPVFPTREVGLVIGVVAENHDSTTYLRSVQEIQEHGTVYKEHQHEVIRYGIFVTLAEIAPWLEQAVG